jgi:uncharacterized membrane protein
MAEFLVAIAFFVIAHVVPPVPPVRTRLIAWFGRRQYIVRGHAWLIGHDPLAAFVP